MMLRINYIGIKEEKKDFRIVNSKLFRQELDNLPNGRYKITVEKYRKNKSNSQLAWLYGQIYPLVLKGLNDAGWDDITNLDQVDSKMKSMFAQTEIVNRTTGEIDKIPALKREMSTVEFSTYVDAIRDWASEYLNIVIPEPETNYDLKFE